MEPSEGALEQPMEGGSVEVGGDNGMALVGESSGGCGRSQACADSEEGDSSQFSAQLCAEEGLASRIGLVQRGKASSEGENGKVSAVGTLVRLGCCTSDGCGEGASSGNHKEKGPNEGVVDAKGSFAPHEATLEEERDTPCGVLVENSDSGGEERVEQKDVASEEGCEEEEGAVGMTTATQGSVVAQEASSCLAHCAAESVGCGDGGRGKKRRSEADGGLSRKRRRRKARRKASTQESAAPSPPSSSDCEGETRRVGDEDDGDEVLPGSSTQDEEDQQFCLRWNNFLSNITSQFGTLREDEDFVDVTLACGGMHVKAHRVVLSACSPYFKRMLKSVPHCQHPVVFLEGIQPSHLLSLVAFMYCGEVGVRRGQLAALLSAAHALQIRGLTEMTASGGRSCGEGELEAENGDASGVEEKVVLSARREAVAVEKVLRDIGFVDMEDSPKRIAKRGMGHCGPEDVTRGTVSSRGGRVASRQHQSMVPGEVSRGDVGTSSSRLKGKAKEHQGALRNCVGVKKKEEDDEMERGGWLSATTVRHAPSSAPLLPLCAELDAVGSSASSKNGVASGGASTEDSLPRVNSLHSDGLLVAANLVDVRLGSSPVHDEPEDPLRGLVDVPGAFPRHSLSVGPFGRTSPGQDVRASEADGRSVWDPGEGGDCKGESCSTQSHLLEPRVDLGLTTTDLIKPKEECASDDDDGEEPSLPNAVALEAKAEHQELVAVGTSLSLQGHQVYRSHILDSPTVSQLHHKRPGVLSNVAYVPHFPPPTTEGGASSAGRRGVVTLETGGGGGGGHLKWEMPRPCPVCQRIYSNNSNLRRHLRTIHEEYYEAHVQ